VYIDHEFVTKNSVEFREYQINIADAALKKNTLVVLPTGLGKTVIALMLIAKKLANPNEKILFLAPTKPLVTQHTAFLQEFLTVPKEEIIIFTGEVSPEKRKELWDAHRIIVSTPQVIENDLLTGRINLGNVSLLIFDEAHHATGNYAYVFINQQYKLQHKHPHVFGMTASPGNDSEKILAICENLSIQHVEIRSKQDPDVEPYVHDISFSWKKITVPDDFLYAIQLMRNALSIRLKPLKEMELIDSDSVSTITKTKLLDAQKKVQMEIRSRVNPPTVLFTAAATQSEALKLYYAIEILQTQGVQSVRQYFQRMQLESSSKSGSKSSKHLMQDPLVLEAVAYLKSLQIEHPKLDAVEEIVAKQLGMKPDSLIIVFTHYRDTSIMVEERLTKNPLIRPIRFVGQGGKLNDKGLTQKQQADIVEKFRKGIYNVLIATSVAEEGLDIPSTELVIFYEPIPSEIRNIQRRGRTARKMPGKVVILITKGTPDEGYYWASKRREKQMRSELELLRAKIQTSFEKASSFPLVVKEQRENQQVLESYDAGTDSIVIIVDHREYRSTVARLLTQKSLLVKPKMLDVGDYIVSSRIGVERKTVDDFLSSLISGKLFDQLQRLRGAYPRPILVLEGKGLFAKRNMNHHAIFGSLIAICVDFGIPILTTETPEETADLLFVMAKREQKQEQKPVALRGEKPSLALSEQQRFVVEGLPLISAVLAKRLLHHFGSIHALVNATPEELQEVFGVGKRIAQEVYRVLHEEFNEE
jgi:Fanconi anemia group M protein